MYPDFPFITILLQSGATANNLLSPIADTNADMEYETHPVRRNGVSLPIDLF